MTCWIIYGIMNTLYCVSDQVNRVCNRSWQLLGNPKLMCHPLVLLNKGMCGSFCGYHASTR